MGSGTEEKNFKKNLGKPNKVLTLINNYLSILVH